ncbi:MAG: hypothetical protein KDJ41_17805 [Hyphomicrobiaceae bacterium]|nr:hypothetical protein [Hyphomicrobiaceae bacterium]
MRHRHECRPGWLRPAVSAVRVMLALALLVLLAPLAARAQAPTPPASGWQPETRTRPPVRPTPPPQPKAKPPTTGRLTFVAVLTEDGQPIEQGLSWFIYDPKAKLDKTLKPLAVSSLASPTFDLAPGEYLVVAALGRAHLARKLTVGAGSKTSEQFVLNAGGLRLRLDTGSGALSGQTSVLYDIYSDERDRFGNRILVVRGAKPGVVVRLNAGIYHVISTYGDANAVSQSDVTVEAGKLTDVGVYHAAARVTFKLVQRAGGEALADTRWVILTPGGEIVKETAGALPTHILAAGTYLARARLGNQTYQKRFTVKAGEVAQVEVLMQ